MINRVYRLKTAEFIDVDYEGLNLDSDSVIVRPTYLSICAADQRYYWGKRPPDVMAKKLPMALIHEGIGTVLKDNTGTFRSGQAVVMIPNIPGSGVSTIKDNYKRDSRFLSSGYDGFMQDCIALDPIQLVPLPDNAGVHYVLCELLSVACNAITTWKRVSQGRGMKFGVWGSGSVGYATALVLRMMYPESNITVIGRHRNKLQYFTFANECICNNELPRDEVFDCCFECVGGIVSQSAINQMIDITRPQGAIILMGVSEESVAINTRMILEKGLVLLGASRSDKTDFETAVSLIQKNAEMASYLDAIISQVLPIVKLQDIGEAFRSDTSVPFKTVLEWRM